MRRSAPAERSPNAVRGQVCGAGNNLTLRVFVALAVAIAAGCAPEHVCEELSSCGGNLEGTWVNDASCRDDLHRGQPPSSIRSQPTTPAGEVPPEPSSTDWCSGIVFDNDGSIRRFVPWRPLLPIAEAKLEYTRGDAVFVEGRYDFAVLYSGQPEFDLSPRCLTQHGTHLTCEELGPALEESQKVDADISNFQCAQLADGGCRCTYDVLSFGGSSGTWDSGDDIVHHFGDNRGPISRANYCVQGDTMEMSGSSLGYLFNEPGLRTMRFHRQ